MNKLALITGASSGIGRELALIHAEQGGDLIIVSRTREDLDALKAEIEALHQVSVTCLPKDLSSPTAAQEIYDEVKSQALEIDYLINNAGFGGTGLFHERSMAADLAMLQVNIVSLTALTRLFLPELVARKQGRILNVSSTASLIPGPLQAVYFASKAYVTSFSHALSSELKGTGVTVTALMPGPTETRFGARSGMEKTNMFKKTFSARLVAQGGYDAMMAGKLKLIIGVTAVQRLLLMLSPLMPKCLLLPYIKKEQSDKG